MKKNSTSSSETSLKQNEYVFSIDDQRTILISSCFESGNIVLVKQVNELNYILEALNDIEHIQSKKCWFYFKVRSEKGIKIRMIIQNVNIYETIFEDGKRCKPIMREGLQAEWKEVSQSFLTYRDELALIIDYSFKNSEDVYFCLTVPFTYSDNEQYLFDLKKFIHPNILYQDQLLAVTPKKNNVHLITITQHSQTSIKRNNFSEQRKPVILITARVHPGEVSSSFCLQGILDFLLSYHNLQAYLLRRLFIFKIVPMLNPDGVVEGNYRADPQGFNLNRFYLDPSKQQHPAIFQILQLIKRTGASQKLQFYFDLHSHSAIKEAFIYGNAFDDIVSQTYSQVYCKILQENFPRFRYYLSNFGQNHMKHKDKGELLSKEGCGRVVISKLCEVICSYTVESSIFPSAYTAFIHKKVKNEEKNQYFQISSQQTEPYYFIPLNEGCDTKENIIITQNKKLGKSLMISILDMIQKNPYTRLNDSFVYNFCKELSGKLLQNEERFKLMDIKAYQKARNINEYIKNQFQDSLAKQWNFSGIVNFLNQSSWPPEVTKIPIFNELFMTKASSKASLKKIRMRTQGKEKLEPATSLRREKMRDIKMMVLQKDNNFVDSHRTISPQPQNPSKPMFPEIKYSIQMKALKKQSIQIRQTSVKEINLNFGQELEKCPKRLIIDYINDEVSKLSPEKPPLKRNNSSLNRMIANKILQKERQKNRISQLNTYQNIVVQSRKRIATECLEQSEKKDIDDSTHKERHTMNSSEDTFKGLELKKTEIVKKRLLLSNKAVQILKKGDRPKIKLPQVAKVNLVIQNSFKEKPLPINNADERAAEDSFSKK